MIRPLLLLFLLWTSASAAERPTGFLGIDWGAAPEEAKRKMQARPGVKFPDDADDYKFELTGGTFAGVPVTKWIFEFPERKFASATVILKHEGSAQSLHKEFRTQLIAKYGSATSDRKISKGGKRANYGGAAMLGTSTVWKFIPNLSDKSTISISCEVAGPNGQATADEAQLAVSVRYMNETILAAAAANVATPPKAGPAAVKKDEL